MIKSMTGFGRCQGTCAGATVTIEVRSVNHRFLETSIRLPKSMGRLEEVFKKSVQRHCARGRVDLTVVLQGGQGTGRLPQLDENLAKHYHQALRTLQRTLKLKGSIDIALMAGFRDVIVLSDQTTDDPKLLKFVERLGAKAVSDMVTMRKKEGGLLAKDMLGRLACVRTCKTTIANRTTSVAQEAFDRMKRRVEKLIGDVVPDLPRLNQELAIYADRCDITEELVRLDAHMIQFEKAVQHSEPVGKTLDFLLQEMGREVNTIGSKANDAVVAAEVVRMKAELERVREQVQNVE
ncbi:YicC/YloC family endoribonuclease [Nitrospira sp. CMX1]|nr:YicC family protein [Nitrospira sp.]